MELDTKNLFNFKYLIKCTLDGKITWATLTFFLNDLTPTLPKAKDLLKIMLKEFEAFHKKSIGNPMKKEKKQDDGELDQKDETVEENIFELDEYDNNFEILQENESSDKTLNDDDFENENDVHDEIKNFGCQLCNEKFHNGSKLKKHIDEKHNKEKNFEFQEAQLLADEIEENIEINDIDIGDDLEKNEDIFNDTDHKDDKIDKENEASKEPFKCLNCDKEYTLKHSFRRHCRKVHPEDYQRSKKKVDKPFKCKRCEGKFSSKIYLRKHNKRVHDGTKAVCDFCGESFCDLKKHMLVHTRETPYECNVCSKRFSKLERLKFHEGVHTFLKVKCSFCDKKLRSQASLTQHERIHTGEKPYLCSHCEKSFNSSHTLKIHEKSHTESKIYPCKTCGKMFKSKQGFELHEKNHSTENQIKCNQCGKTFVSKAGLKVHQSYKCPSRSKESAEKFQTLLKYECKLCDKKFQFQSGLKDHQKVHEKVTQMNLNSSVDKSFQCKVCKKCLANRKSYNYHLKTHDSERELPFKCRLCPKSFITSIGIKNHEESHGKELKPVEENKVVIE